MHGLRKFANASAITLSLCFSGVGFAESMYTEQSLAVDGQGPAQNPRQGTISARVLGLSSMNPTEGCELINWYGENRSDPTGRTPVIQKLTKKDVEVLLRMQENLGHVWGSQNEVDVNGHGWNPLPFLNGPLVWYDHKHRGNPNQKYVSNAVANYFEEKRIWDEVPQQLHVASLPPIPFPAGKLYRVLSTTCGHLIFFMPTVCPEGGAWHTRVFAEVLNDDGTKEKVYSTKMDLDLTYVPGFGTPDPVIPGAGEFPVHWSHDDRRIFGALGTRSKWQSLVAIGTQLRNDAELRQAQADATIMEVGLFIGEFIPFFGAWRTIWEKGIYKYEKWDMWSDSLSVSTDVLVDALPAVAQVKALRKVSWGLYGLALSGAIANAAQRYARDGNPEFQDIARVIVTGLLYFQVRSSMADDAVKFMREDLARSGIASADAGVLRSAGNYPRISPERTRQILRGISPMAARNIDDLIMLMGLTPAEATVFKNLGTELTDITKLLGQNNPAAIDEAILRIRSLGVDTGNGIRNWGGDPRLPSKILIDDWADKGPMHLRSHQLNLELDRTVRPFTAQINAALPENRSALVRDALINGMELSVDRQIRKTAAAFPTLNGQLPFEADFDPIAKVVKVRIPDIAVEDLPWLSTRLRTVGYVGTRLNDADADEVIRAVEYQIRRQQVFVHIEELLHAIGGRYNKGFYMADDSGVRVHYQAILPQMIELERWISLKSVGNLQAMGVTAVQQPNAKLEALRNVPELEVGLWFKANNVTPPPSFKNNYNRHLIDNWAAEVTEP